MKYSGILGVFLLLGAIGQGNVLKHSDAYTTLAPASNPFKDEWPLTKEEGEIYRKVKAPPKRCELKLCSECIAKNGTYITLLNGNYVCAHVQELNIRPGIQRGFYTERFCQQLCRSVTTEPKSNGESDVSNPLESVVESNALMANSEEVVPKPSCELEPCKKCIINNGNYAEVDDGNFQCFHFMSSDIILEIVGHVGESKLVISGPVGCEIFCSSGENINDRSTNPKALEGDGSQFLKGSLKERPNSSETLAPTNAVKSNELVGKNAKNPNVFMPSRCDFELCTKCLQDNLMFVKHWSYVTFTNGTQMCMLKQKRDELKGVVYRSIADVIGCQYRCPLDVSTSQKTQEVEENRTPNPPPGSILPVGSKGGLESVTTEKPKRCDYNECVKCLQDRGTFLLPGPRCLASSLENIKIGILMQLNSVDALINDPSHCEAICSEDSYSNKIISR